MGFKWLQHVLKSKHTYKHPMERTTDFGSRQDDPSRQADNHHWSSVPGQGGCHRKVRASGISSPSLGSPSLQKEGHYTCPSYPTELWLELASTGAPESRPERHRPAILLSARRPGDGARATSLPWFPDSIQSAAQTAQGVPAIFLSSPCCHPCPPWVPVGLCAG